MASSAKKRRKNSYPKDSYSRSFSKYFPEPSTHLFPSSKSEFSRLIAVVAIAASVAVLCSSLINHINCQPKPFCDSGGDFDTSVYDHCERCPSNGICKEGKLECARGFRKQGRLCVEDKDINVAAKILSELVRVRVCKAYAQYSCSGTETFWMRKDELWTYLDHHNVVENYGLDETMYLLAKLRAIETSRRLLETRINAGGFEEFKCPESLVGHYKPISCRVRCWRIKHAAVVVPISVSLVGWIFILLKVRRRRRLSVRAEELYDQLI